MEAFRTYFNELKLGEGLEGWCFQCYSKPEEVKPPHLLIKWTSSLIDGETPCWKQGVTNHWEIVRNVKVLREHLQFLEEKYQSDKKMQQLVAAIPDRPKIDDISQEHQYTNDECELLIWDVLDDMWRPIDDYEQLVAAEQDTKKFAKTYDTIFANTSGHINGASSSNGTTKLASMDGTGKTDDPGIGDSEFEALMGSLGESKNSVMAGLNYLENKEKDISTTTSKLLVGTGPSASSSSHPEKGLTEEEKAAAEKKRQKIEKKKRAQQRKKLEMQLGLAQKREEDIPDVYISHLPEGTTKEILEEEFRSCGQFSVDLISKEPHIKLYFKTDPITNQPGKEFRGDALIKYLHPASAANAIQRWHEAEFIVGKERSTISVQRAVAMNKHTDNDSKGGLKQKKTLEELQQLQAQRAFERELQGKGGDGSTGLERARKGKGGGKKMTARQQQLFANQMDDMDSKKADKLKKNIVLRNMFDKKSIADQGSDEATFLKELHDELMEGVEEMNFGSTNMILATGKKQEKKKVKIYCFVGAQDRGFVILQFDSADDAEYYKAYYHGRKFDGRTVRADYHDGTDLKGSSRGASYGFSGNSNLATGTTNRDSPKNVPVHGKQDANSSAFKQDANSSGTTQSSPDSSESKKRLRDDDLGEQSPKRQTNKGIDDSLEALLLLGDGPIPTKPPREDRSPIRPQNADPSFSQMKDSDDEEGLDVKEDGLDVAMEGDSDNANVMELLRVEHADTGRDDWLYKDNDSGSDDSDDELLDVKVD